MVSFLLLNKCFVFWLFSHETSSKTIHLYCNDKTWQLTTYFHIQPTTIYSLHTHTHTYFPLLHWPGPSLIHWASVETWLFIPACCRREKWLFIQWIWSRITNVFILDHFFLTCPLSSAYELLSKKSSILLWIQCLGEFAERMTAVTSSDFIV